MSTHSLRDAAGVSDFVLVCSRGGKRRRSTLLLTLCSGYKDADDHI